MTLSNAYNGKSVLVTGHTGFKGAWLCEWLIRLGAEVWGFSLEPETHPNLFRQLSLTHRVHSRIADLRDTQAVRGCVEAAQPDFVFHLAAQPLVSRSYADPVETYQTNVLGTIHVLEALRRLEKPCAAVLVTTDKCYENPEDGRPFAETAPLGGHDPYSSSKACAEIAISSWRRSYFPTRHPVAIASARAGNVIGGGDWAENRLVPDVIRSLHRNETIRIRHPEATRPWQHVLEPLCGYLVLAHQLADADARRESVDADHLRSAFNFGPDPEANRSVREVVNEMLTHWNGEWEHQAQPDALHEAGLLQLDIQRAQTLLGWKPVWDFKRAIRETVHWYRSSLEDANLEPAALTQAQIEDYEATTREQGLPFFQENPAQGHDA